MDVVLQSLTQHASAVTLVLLISVVGLLALNLSTMARMRRTEAKWRQILSGSSGESLEQMLLNHFTTHREFETRLGQLDGKLSNLAGKMLTTKRFLGLVRYDAFPDVAGNQSFALALYDDNGDGAIISSIVGRTSCRVYCKPLVGGRSERDLSQEENRAFREASDSGLKTILSH
jgi:hypothetical protein